MLKGAEVKARLDSEMILFTWLLRKAPLIPGNPADTQKSSGIKLMVEMQVLAEHGKIILHKHP